MQNAASASTSLADAFRYERALQNLSTARGVTLPRAKVFPLTLGRSGSDMMHTHAFSVHTMRAYLRKRKLAPARCFVLTVRDPAARLSSAFRDSFMHGERLTGAVGRKRIDRNITAMIRRLRDPFAFPEWPLPDHRDGVQGRWRLGSGVAYLCAHRSLHGSRPEKRRPPIDTPHTLHACARAHTMWMMC